MAKRMKRANNDAKRSPQAKQATIERKATRRLMKLNSRKY